MTRKQWYTKRLLDVIFAVVFLVVAAPLLLIISLAILVVDGRPVFFRHARLGRDGQVFDIWKFRTMINDADRYLSADGTATRNRITRTGKWLRYLSLDELPQLINILWGEMSFVGPRPALPDHGDRYTDTQRRRLEVLPGVTGLAQVHGRNTLKWSKRIEYDIEYIDRYSLVLDFKILFRTIGVVLFRRGIVLDRNADQVDDLGK